MRLLHGRLLAVSLAVAGWASAVAAAFQVVHADVGNTDGTAAVITFESDDFADGLVPLDSVFATPGTAKTFHFYSTAKDISVVSVTLYSLTAGVIATAQPAGAGASTARAAKSKRDANAVPLSLTVTSTKGVDRTDGAIALPDTQLLVDSFAGQALYFEIAWTLASAVHGATYSRTFAYVAAADINAYLSKSAFLSTNPVSPETKFGGSSTASGRSSTANLVATVAATTDLKTAAATGTAATSATGAAATMAGTTPTAGASPASASSHKKKSGIGGGAIAGIVIGVVVGVVLVAGLLFWLMRKRRDSARAQGLLPGPAEPYLGAGAQNGAGSPTADNLMAEKDGDARGAVPGATQGPYSDDDGTAGGAGAREVASSVPAVTVSGAAAAASAAPAARAASVAPSATSSVDVVSTAAAASGSGGAAPVIPGQVAALIEDHMTPEDVARLEAEERQLDADIENAIRNRTNEGSR